MSRKKSLKLSLLVVVVFIMLFQVACSNNTASNDKGSNKTNSKTNNSNSSQSSSNSQDEKIVLKALTSKHPYQSDWNDMMVFEEREKVTNVHVEWENIAEGTTWIEKRNLKLASNDLPDFIARSSLSNIEVETYAKQGIIIPLNDLIDNHMPTFKAILDENPSIRKTITAADGNIYAFPVINGWLGDNSRKLWLKQTWLDDLNLKTPTTLDEFVDVLKAFRDSHDGNSPLYISLNNAVEYFGGSFGIGTKGGGNARSLGFDLDESGNVRFVKTDPVYKELLMFLNKLYSEKLLHPNSITSYKEEEHVSLANAGLVGGFISHNAEPHNPSEFTIVAPFKSNFADLPLFTTFNSGIWRNQLVITSANKYPEETAKWLDHWYSDEGWVEMQYGFEGITYEVDKDGGYWWTPEYDHLVQPIEKSRGQFSPMFGLGLPYNMTSDELVTKRPWRKESFEQAAIGRIDEAIAMLAPYTDPVMANGVDEFMFTSEEMTIVKSFQSEALQYATEMETKLIIGQESFDNWDKYVQDLSKMGLDQYLEVLNAANERYKNL